MLAELRREVGRLVVETTAKVTGKVLTTRRPAASGRGNRRKSWRPEFTANSVKISKQARRDAKELFLACRVDGVLDEAKVRAGRAAGDRRPSRAATSPSSPISSGW